MHHNRYFSEAGFPRSFETSISINNFISTLSGDDHERNKDPILPYGGNETSHLLLVEVVSDRWNGSVDQSDVDCLYFGRIHFRRV